MARSLSLNGSSFSIPQTGDTAWSDTGGVDDYLVALATGVLSKAGGTFTLTAEANFGATYGIKLPYVKSATASPAAAGVLRLANGDTINFRNAANSADVTLGVNGSDQLVFAGNPVVTLALGAANTSLVMNGAGTAYVWSTITNTQIDAAAAIAYSKLNLTGTLVNADISASAAIAYSKLSLGSSIATTDLASGLLVPVGKGGTGVVSTATFPASGVVVTEAATETLTNKTLTSPVINTPTGIVKGDVGLGNVDNTSDATKNAASVTLTNKTLTSPVLATPVITGSTDYTNTTAPATPSAGHTALYPSSVDGKFHFINSSGTDSVLGASGSGELNLVGNPSDAVGWTSGTGYTVATTTTAGDLPLSSMVATAIKITSGTGTSAEATLAQTNSYSFTTPASYAVKTKIEFWLRPGTNFASNEWTISVYAGSTRQALTTDSSSVTYIPNLNGKFTTYFDAAASTAYTVRFTRVNNAGTNAGVLNVTNVIVGPGIQPQGAVVGPWISYTPTLGVGAVRGTNTEKAQWRQVGSAIEILYDYTQTVAGTAGSGQYTWSLPPGYTVDTTKVSLQSSVLGNGYGYNGTTEYTGFVVPVTSTGLGLNIFTSISAVANASQATLSFGNATQRVQFRATVPVNELAGSGTVNLAQNDVQYYYGTGGTWGTSGTITTAQGPGGVLGGTTTPAGTAFQWTMVPATPIPSGAVAVLHTSPDGIHWTAGYNAVTPHNTAALSFDGTNNIGAGASITSAGNIRVDFGKYSDAGSSTWTGTWYWRVAVGLPGQAVGFGIVNPGTSSGLVAAAGLPGNTTGNAIAAGYVGERISSSVTASSVGTGSHTTITSIALTAGIWDISCLVWAPSTASLTNVDFGIATANNSNTGHVKGDTANTILCSSGTDSGGSVPASRVTISAGATYYLTCRPTGATVALNGRISATRIA